MSLFTYPEARLIAGVDEVGRGPLVGAVVTAAVILILPDRLSGWGIRKSCRKNAGWPCMMRLKIKH